MGGTAHLAIHSCPHERHCHDDESRHAHDIQMTLVLPVVVRCKLDTACRRHRRVAAGGAYLSAAANVARSGAKRRGDSVETRRSPLLKREHKPVSQPPAADSAPMVTHGRRSDPQKPVFSECPVLDASTQAANRAVRAKRFRSVALAGPLRLHRKTHHYVSKRCGDEEVRERLRSRHPGDRALLGHIGAIASIARACLLRNTRN
jgi:hypothetical protein